MVTFEGCARRMGQIDPFFRRSDSMILKQSSCLSKGIDVEQIVKGVQAIAFENAVWAYTLCRCRFKIRSKNCSRGCGKDRRGASGFLYSGQSHIEKSRAWPWKPCCHAPARRD